MKLKIQIKSLAENEILSADEIFVCGSSAEIQEITHVNGQQIIRDYSDSFISNLHKEYLSFCTNATNYDYIELLK